LNNQGIFKALLLAGCAGSFVLAGPAMAQQETPDADEETGADILDTNDAATDPGQSPAPGDTAQTGTIVVTGSRIARQDFEANSPFVTVDEALLEQSSTAALEQNLNRLPQFVPAQTPTAGGDIQPTASNTPGAATVSLRGLGANRTLILVDGRRATPANASGVTDINTIPSAAIERVEVISGGASATYGADAVAGVTNFILKKNFQGLELDGRLGITQYGDGFEYQLSGIMGTDFADGRGNVSMAVSINDRGAQFQRDRPWYVDRYTDPNQANGTAFIYGDPGVVFNAGNPFSLAAAQQVFGADSCFAATASAACPIERRVTQSTAYANFDLTAYQLGSAPTIDQFGNNGGALGGARNFNTPTNGFPYRRSGFGVLGFNNVNSYLILPLTRYNAFMRGNYELNDWVGVFGQGLFTHTTTYTRQEPGPFTGGWGVDIPWGTGVYTGGVYGSSVTAANMSSVIRHGESMTGLPGGTPYNDTSPENLTNNPTNPAFRARYGATGILTCANSDFGGCTNTDAFRAVIPAELQTLLNSRMRPARPGEPGYITPVPGAPPPTQPMVSGANDPASLTGFLPDDRETNTDVMTYNLIAGLEGSIPGMDWTWEAFVSHGESHTFANQTGIYSLGRARALMSSPNFGQNFSQQGNRDAGQTGFGAATANCTTGLNFFGRYQGVSEDCLEAIRGDLKNRSKFRQTIAEANLQGGLFELPAGELRFAAGASYREMDYEFLNEGLTTQGRSFQDQALGIYPSGNSAGFLRVKEVYGELLVPILSDLPFIEQLNLELGGRMSHYNTTGTSYTYKILGDWEVTDWLRFRGGYNRAERAPNIAELFLSSQQTFGFGDSGDYCSTRNPYRNSANAAVNTNAANVQATCRILMDRVDPTGQASTNFYGTTGVPGQPASTSTAGTGFAFLTTVGNPNLDPEKADTWTAGAVIQSPVSSGPLARLRLSLDWFNIEVNDAIGLEQPSTVSRYCFDPAFNPAIATNPAQAALAPACGQLTRDPPNGTLGNIFVSYANNGRFKIQGIDAALDWSADVGPGTFTLNALVNYLLDYKVANLPGDPLTEYVGTQGTGASGLNANSSFEYRIFTTIGYGIGPARVALQWQHFPEVEDATEAVTGAPTPTTGTPSYDLFSLNASYQLSDDVGLRFGVDNLLNEYPPLTNVNLAPTAGNLPGGTVGGGLLDTQGRRFYVGANARF
jgi:outer membrane receptor protein involved in Fe transport